MAKQRVIMIAPNHYPNMKYYKLQYYVDKLKRGEKFSLARYGDGEMLCMWGKQGANSNGCRYSPELRVALLGSMNHKNDPTFIYGMQRVLPQDRTRIEKEYPDVDWHDTEIFSEAVANGKLYPLIEQLRKMELVIIGNKSLLPLNKILKPLYFITVQTSNSFEERETVKKSILEIAHFRGKNNSIEDERVYLFSCGMAANALISELHGKYNGWLIDVGHIWDPFVGNMSRCDLEGKTLEDINKNLCPKE